MTKAISTIEAFAAICMLHMGKGSTPAGIGLGGWELVTQVVFLHLSPRFASIATHMGTLRARLEVFVITNDF